MKKIVLSFAFFMSSFASAQTFTADLETARLGESVIQVKIDAAKKSSAKLETVGTLEMIDQGVEGDFLCKNTLNFANAAQAAVTFQSRTGDVYATASVPVSLQIEDVVRTETKADC